MATHIERIYCLENPESGIKKVASESEVKFENVIKEVFGVAFLEDLAKMIRFNKKFQEYICKAHNIKETEITMEMVFRLATKADLLPLKTLYLETYKNNQTTDGKATPPFSSTIQLNDGIFNWDEEEFSYVKINNNENHTRIS